MTVEITPIFVFALGLLVFYVGSLLSIYVDPWLKCVSSGHPITFSMLFSSRLNKRGIQKVVEAYITIKREGAKANFEEISGVYLRNSRNFDEYIALCRKSA